MVVYVFEQGLSADRRTAEEVEEVEEDGEEDGEEEGEEEGRCLIRIF